MSAPWSSVMASHDSTLCALVGEVFLGDAVLKEVRLAIQHEKLMLKD
jgi:hypothetical protein